MSKTYEFPKDFLWGTATSAFQTEGNNKNTDWWKWEHSRPEDATYPLEPSGIACDSYNRYEEDFDLCVKMNNNVVRISIEWARIFPAENKIDQKEVDHYKKVLEAAKKRNLKVFATLLHFTLPQWVADKGGWMNIKTVKYYGEYSKLCAKEFGHLIDFFITINEPLVYAMMAYVNGAWPPAQEDLVASTIVQSILVKAHILAYKEIKAVVDKPVGIVKNMNCFFPAPGKWFWVSYTVAKILTYFNIDFHLNTIKKWCDFIGLNYYFAVRLNGFIRQNIDDVQSDLGWWLYPKGLEEVLLYLKKYKLPVYITENGIADAMDIHRKDFIKNMLISCHDAMQQGVDVKGYFYWSLIDNYEWHQGFWPKFGLVEVDRQNNLQRKPRPSFYYYADICRNGKILT